MRGHCQGNHSPVHPGPGRRQGASAHARASPGHFPGREHTVGQRRLKALLKPNRVRHTGFHQVLKNQSCHYPCRLPGSQLSASNALNSFEETEGPATRRPARVPADVGQAPRPGVSPRDGIARRSRRVTPPSHGPLAWSTAVTHDTHPDTEVLRGETAFSDRNTEPTRVSVPTEASRLGTPGGTANNASLPRGDAVQK